MKCNICDQDYYTVELKIPEDEELPERVFHICDNCWDIIAMVAIRQIKTSLFVQEITPLFEHLLLRPEFEKKLCEELLKNEEFIRGISKKIGFGYASSVTVDPDMEEGV